MRNIFSFAFSLLRMQFVKYAIVGVVATIINLVVAELCAAYVWPCLTGGDLFVKHLGFLGFEPSGVPEAVRAARAVYCNLVGFVVANFVCWLLNRKFVFTPGRHHWAVEFLLFFSGSAFAIACGSGVIYALILFFGFETTWSFVINVVVSVLVNYVVRKFLVFKS